jgi:hypothetical protein
MTMTIDEYDMYHNRFSRAVILCGNNVSESVLHPCAVDQTFRAPMDIRLLVFDVFQTNIAFKDTTVVMSAPQYVQRTLPKQTSACLRYASSYLAILTWGRMLDL